MALKTPYYLIHESRLLKNLKRIRKVGEVSGAKSLLALKCFSTWGVFDLIRQYLDGTTSSSPYEVLLGHEKFGKETHGYSVGYTKEDILTIRGLADKIIFNSVTQLLRFYSLVKTKNLGLRINPGISYSNFDLADPNRANSRLGIQDPKEISKVLDKINGVMFHYNCENDDFNAFEAHLTDIGDQYSDILNKVEWVSLGGGVLFTKDGYPLDAFCRALKDFKERFNVQIYLEPGESAITESAELITSVVDIVHNKIDVAIVDASIEAHLLDLLTYRQTAKIKTSGRYPHMIAGRSCLAGDIFGTYMFPKKLKVGDIIRIQDTAGYSMVKMNWFNGLQMPSIVIKRLEGNLEIARQFTYEDFKNTTSNY